MSKEIKFRAWYKQTPIMVYVDHEANSQSYGKVASNSELFRLADINAYKLMQYTGLKDKNNVEIYESDIVKDPVDSIGVVKWVNARWHIDYSKSKTLGKLDWQFGAPNSLEVIGNIYENKDLL